MRKCDTYVGHEARINKLLLKKPPGIMSARSTSSVCEQSASQTIKGIEKKKWEEGGGQEIVKNIKRWTGSETNSESGARCRIFGDGLRSMGSARVGYPMHLANGTLHRSGLGQ